MDKFTKLMDVIKSYREVEISLNEPGELFKSSNNGKEWVHQKTCDDYGRIPKIGYIYILELRKNAIKKYSPSNHVYIPCIVNTTRAIRHLLSAATTKTDICNTEAEEITHALARICMGIENSLFELNKNNTDSYKDIVDTLCWYDKTEADKLYTPSLSLYPSAFRRIACVINDDKVYELCKDAQENKYEYIDAINEILMDLLSNMDYLDKCINTLIICGAILLHCISSIIEY